MIIIETIILFSGYISPRLPFGNHTGLRLPWTVRDEAAWNVAHRILGYISLPIAVIYLAAALTMSNFEAASMIAVLALVGIPGIISLAFFTKKIYGKR